MLDFPYKIVEAKHEGTICCRGFWVNEGKVYFEKEAQCLSQWESIPVFAPVKGYKDIFEVTRCIDMEFTVPEDLDEFGIESVDSKDVEFVTYTKTPPDWFLIDKEEELIKLGNLMRENSTGLPVTVCNITAFNLLGLYHSYPHSQEHKYVCITEDGDVDNFFAKAELPTKTQID